MKFHFLLLFIFLGLGIGSAVFAQEVGYTPIVGVPGLTNVDSYSTEEYVQALYYLAITVGAILAVYKIISGGVKWMFDGVITHKEEGKKEIWGAIIGLLIILSAVLVLNTINVNLTNLNIFGDAPSLGDINASPQTGPITISNINAKPGDSFNISDYSLDSGPRGPIFEEANRRFAETCKANGGIYIKHLFSSWCAPNLDGNTMQPNSEGIYRFDNTSGTMDLPSTVNNFNRVCREAGWNNQSDHYEDPSDSNFIIFKCLPLPPS